MSPSGGASSPPPERRRSRRAGEIKHGTPGGYRKGCRCGKCCRAKSAQRAEERRRRAERLKSAQNAAAPDAPAEPAAEPEPSPPADPGDGSPGEPGPVEAAVLEEVKAHDGAPGVAPLAAVAIALAKEIDEAAGTSVAGAARQLVATLTEMRKLSKATDDELAKFLAGLNTR